MSKKFTIEETREVFKSVGLELLENEAKGIDYKYKCKDKDGYLYKRSTHTCQHSLKRKKRYAENCEHTFSTKNPYFYHNMLFYLDKINSSTILLTKQEDIKNIDQKLKFKCGYCGREFDLPWHSFYHKQDKCCNICFRQKRTRGETNTNHIDTNKFHQKALENKLVILDGAQIKYHDKIVVQDAEGYRGLTSPAVIMRDSSFERFGGRNPYALDNLRIFAFKKGWDCVIYNQEYKGTRYPIKMMCSCGNDFEVNAGHFVEGKYKCNECRVKQSAIADKVELWLNINNVAYDKEKRFPDCVYQRTLPFDFYLSDYHACVEVDGIGHYRPINFAGKDKKRAQETFELRKITDEVKTNYCKKQNIPLLRIPFWVLEKDEHEKMLQEFVKSLSIKSNDLNK